MATEPNTGYFHEQSLGSPVMNRLAVSFQSSAVSSSSDVGTYFGLTQTTTSSGMISQPGNSSMNMINSPSGLLQPGNSSGSSLLLDSVPGIKHDTGSTPEWSADEQYKLEESLERFKDEPNIMKYIKIAATLRDKTVRDVALRCRWMTRKRRKAEENNAGKKVNNRKDKLVQASSQLSLTSSISQNMGTYPSMMAHPGQNERMPFEGISGGAIHLLEQNVLVFRQIASNLSMYKLQDNITLFCQTRNNIAAILNDMRDMPGIMNQMPPLPVLLNEDLANSILPDMTQPIMFGSPSGIHLKQEPRC